MQMHMLVASRCTCCWLSSCCLHFSLADKGPSGLLVSLLAGWLETHHWVVQNGIFDGRLLLETRVMRLMVTWCPDTCGTAMR
jgi:hypothetical protein